MQYTSRNYRKSRKTPQGKGCSLFALVEKRRKTRNTGTARLVNLGFSGFSTFFYGMYGPSNPCGVVFFDFFDSSSGVCVRFSSIWPCQTSLHFGNGPVDALQAGVRRR